MGQEVTLTVTLDAQGKVHVSGPLGEISLCIKMLGAALQTVGQYHDQQQKSVIQPARIVPIGLGVKP